MNRFSHTLKKAVTGFLALLIAFTATYAPIMPRELPGHVPEANAVWGIFDINVVDIILQVLNGLAWALAKAAIRSITQSTVNWINSGFEGSPAYATDLSRNLRQTADGYIAGKVRELLTTTTVSSPYLQRVVGAVVQGYLLYTSRDLIAERIRYTLAERVRNEAEFLRGDFRQGGFEGWMSMTLTCGNDPFCAQLAVQESIAQGVADETNEQINDFLGGNGFFSWRCGCAEGEEPAGEGANLSDANENSSCRVCTPGSVIESQLEQQVGSSVTELQLADSINEIIGALAMALVNQVLGPNGLGGTSQASSGSGRSYLEQIASDPTSFSGDLANGFQQGLQSERSRIDEYKNGWENIRDAAQSAVAACSLPGGSNEKRQEAREAYDRAQAGVTRAGQGIAALAELEGRLETVASSTNPTVAMDFIRKDYECLVRGGILEGPVESRTCRVPLQNDEDPCPERPSPVPTNNESACIIREGQDMQGFGSNWHSKLDQIAHNGCH